MIGALASITLLAVDAKCMSDWIAARDAFRASGMHGMTALDLARDVEAADAACREEARAILRSPDLEHTEEAKHAVARARAIVEKLDADHEALRTGASFDAKAPSATAANPGLSCDPQDKAVQVVLVVGRQLTITTPFEVRVGVLSAPDVLQATKLDKKRVVLFGKKTGVACYTITTEKGSGRHRYDVRVISEDLARVRDDLQRAIQEIEDPAPPYEELVIFAGCSVSIPVRERVLGVRVEHERIVDAALTSSETVRIDGKACGMSYVDIEELSQTTTYRVAVVDPRLSTPRAGAVIVIPKCSRPCSSR